MVVTRREAGLPHMCERKQLCPPEGVTAGLPLTWTLRVGLGCPRAAPTASGSDPGAVCPWPQEAFWLTAAQDQCETQGRKPGKGNKKCSRTLKE